MELRIRPTGASIDGVNSTSMRSNTGGGPGSQLTFRTENIQEFTVQSGELDRARVAGEAQRRLCLSPTVVRTKFHGRVLKISRMLLSTPIHGLPELPI